MRSFAGYEPAYAKPLRMLFFAIEHPLLRILERLVLWIIVLAFIVGRIENNLQTFRPKLCLHYCHYGKFPDQECKLNWCWQFFNPEFP